MTYVTYPLVKETRLLLNIINNLNIALVRSVDSFLLYERHYKRIMRIPETFKEKLELFLHLGRKYGFSKEEIDMIKTISGIIESHKKSPVEFSRKEKFVIFSDSFSSYKSIDVDTVKNYLSKAKVFISRVGNILING